MTAGTNGPCPMVRAGRMPARDAAVLIYIARKKTEARLKVARPAAAGAKAAAGGKCYEDMYAN